MTEQRQQAEVLWSPVADWRDTTRIGQYVRWLEERHGLSFDGWDDLWAWSVRDQEGFWTSVWEYFGVESEDEWARALGDAEMPGARWFEGASLNYARHLLADTSHDDATAVIAYSQTREKVELTFGELRAQVAAARAGMLRLGVGRGDRVVAYMPNIPETLIACIAAASIGAVWASCAPEFGARSVIDRFSQIEPTLLLAVDGYMYGDKYVDRTAEVELVREGLITVQHVVHVPYGRTSIDGAVAWSDLTDPSLTDALAFEAVPFDHPLWVLFSSGTTGKPKPIVHGHGGILLEHLKNHSFSWDLGSGDTLLWFSTTAWMMWNCLVSALLVRSAIVLIDGNPVHPDLTYQWRIAAETGATVMGASPGFLMASRAAGLRPSEQHDLSSLKQIAAAGSPLPAEGYRWVAEQFDGVLLNVGSGGTDVCSAIVQGSPLQEVTAGRMSGPALGVDAHAFDPQGNEVVGELGELVITSPLPSMPVAFWGDADGSRYSRAYFDVYPGVWCHGDWIEFDERGSCVISGRSDATLNRGGVRLGTAEFYRVVEEMDAVRNSLVVHIEDPDGGNGELILLVELSKGQSLDAGLRKSIATELRTQLSPRHVPDTVHAVEAVPMNRTGKKLELPVKRILLGWAVDDAVSRDVLANPEAIDAVLDIADHRQREATL